MTPLGPDLHVLLGQLEWTAFSELNDLLDYIYKSPRLLAHEKDLERRKLAAYFPDGGKYADIREHNESIKLYETFPRLIAMGNLFIAISTFENYVFELLRILREQDPTLSKPEMSRGITEHLKATKAYGAEPHKIKSYEQVRAAISIRNCLMHARGLLATSSQANTIRAFINQQKFLGSDLRKLRSNGGQSPDRYEVTIEGAGLSERLVITNEYSFLACAYLRDYFCDLCGMLNPNTSLRPIVHYMDPRELSEKLAPQGSVM